jgi:hypothetical protein
MKPICSSEAKRISLYFIEEPVDQLVFLLVMAHHSNELTWTKCANSIQHIKSNSNKSTNKCQNNTQL